MSIRDKLNQNSLIATAGAVVVLLISLAVLFRPFARAPNVSHNVYFYDLGSNQLIVEKDDVVPPILAPLGGSNLAVRAYVYACGDCSDPANRDIYYLEMTSPEARAALVAQAARSNPTAQSAPPEPVPGEADAVRLGHLIRGKDQKDWVQADSAEANKVLAAAQTKCGQKPVKMCLPPD